MTKSLSAFVAGLVFGLGLAVSQMINPEKVLAFLTLGPDWDPSLALVMGGALLVTAPGYRLLTRTRTAPLLDERFHIPAKSGVDRRLLLGALVFGAGWGLAGFCPGPALAAIGVGSQTVWIFVAAMAAGTVLADRPILTGRATPPDEEGDPARAG